jgi:hypothetical protein
VENKLKYPFTCNHEYLITQPKHKIFNHWSVKLEKTARLARTDGNSKIE